MTVKGVCVFECIVVEREGDIVECESFPLDGDVREFWEIEITGCKWDEGQAFYMVIPKASLEQNDRHAKLAEAAKVLKERAEKIHEKVRELEDAMVVSLDTLHLEFEI